MQPEEARREAKISSSSQLKGLSSHQEEKGIPREYDNFVHFDEPLAPLRNKTNVRG